MRDRVYVLKSVLSYRILVKNTGYLLPSTHWTLFSSRRNSRFFGDESKAVERIIVFEI